MAARKKPVRRKAETSTGNTNSSFLGSLVRVDPEDAAKRILKAHRDTGGNSTQAAEVLGVTYPHLLTLIARLSAPIVDPKAAGVERTILLAAKRGEDPTATLREHIDAMRGDAGAGETPEIAADVLRTMLDKEVDKGTRLAHLAAAVKVGEKSLDLSLLSKFRQGQRSLALEVRRKLRKVLDGLGDKVAEPRQGRRAAPSPTKRARA